MLPLLPPAALAEDVPVLVSAFQPQNTEATDLAASLEAILGQRLAAEAGVQVLRVEDAPDWDGASARLYMDVCPPTDIAGCTLVTADRAGARYAVTGTVIALAGGARVQVSIVDIDASRVMLSFRSELAPGQDAAFADGVARVVMAALGGDVGAEDDIRDGEPPAARLSNAELAAQLAELSVELGSLTELVERDDRVLEPPPYTREEHERWMRAEGTPPWERVGMSGESWYRYKQSGMPLYEWREKSLGRQYELHLRGFGGWWLGPTDQLYYNRYAYDAALSVEDTYSAEAVRSGGSGTLAFEAAFGVLPALDVGVGAGVGTSRLTADVSSVEAQADPATLSRVTPFFGPRATLMLFPTRDLRVGAGAGVTFARTTSLSEAVQVVPATAWVFPAQWLAYAEAWPAGEARLGEQVDAFVRVPVGVRIGGAGLREHRETLNAALDPVAPASGAVVTVGVLAGIQVRLLGREAPRVHAVEEAPPEDD